MKRTTIIAALAIAAATLALPAIAASPSPTPKSESIVVVGTVLPLSSINTACDAQIWNVDEPACAYWEKQAVGYTQATAYVCYTRGAATTVYMQCDGAIDNATPWASFQTGTPATSSITMANLPYAWDTSGITAGQGDCWRVNLKINDAWFRCRYWSTAGTTNDKVIVRLTLGSP